MTIYKGNSVLWDDLDRANNRVQELEADLAAARKRIAEMEKARRWVSVKERLPEKDYEDIGDEIIALLDYPFDRPVALKYHHDYGFYSGGWGAPQTNWTEHVTHWRPLPEPPEGEGE